MLASLKRQNIDVKVLIVEFVNQVYEEESSNEDKGKDKFLMARTKGPIVDKESVSSSQKDDLAKAMKESKHIDQDSSSLYQVNKFISYYDNEKT